MTGLLPWFGSLAGIHVPERGRRVRLVHSMVPGRLRLEVRGLYRNGPLGLRIEAGLMGQSGVRKVVANPLTGKVLIFHDPDRPFRDMAALLERLLAVVDGGQGWESGTGVVRHVSRDTDRPPGSPPWHGRRQNRQVAPVPAEDSSPAWHLLGEEQLLASLGSSRRHGLSQVGVAQALQRYGSNVLPQPSGRSPWEIFLSQFQSMPVALLLGSALLAAATGGIADAVVILGVVLINAGIGHVTEIQTERAIRSLAGPRERMALVLREGNVREIDAGELVPGDIVALVPGSAVAADVRLLEARNLTIDESALTGESLPVIKTADPLDIPDVPLADRINMAYMGTVVTGGSGVGVVVATGPHTQIGRIEALISDARPPETPMQRQLDRLGRQMVWLSAATCGVVFAVGLLRGQGLLQMLSTSVSLAVAAVPEGLPTVATTTLAMGVQRMRRHQILVRQLDAVETLGAAQVICLDKTGTLTMNRMSVLALQVGLETLRVADGDLWYGGRRFVPEDHDDLMRIIHVAVLCNEVQVEGNGDSYILNGSATEGALVEFALACGIDVARLRDQYPLHTLEHRAQGRNYMRTLHRRQDGAVLLAVKGSPEEVLAMCRWRLVEGERRPLTDGERSSVLAENASLAGDGLRVLGFAYEVAEEETSGPAGEGLVWLGLVGLADPLRQGVAELMGRFHEAGIKTVMITGDQGATALAIGRALGLSGDRPLEIMESGRLERLGPDALAPSLEKVDVFARVSPANKLQIVQGLQRAGRVVAMTGDGINDGPALRAADIGVAMGASGTDTARSVADVVIENDELQTMIVAVREGRTIYNNIRKSVHFLASTNLSEILIMLGALAGGMGQPLNTMQLLWINLLTDVFPALALAVEPPEPDVLQIPPRDPGEPIIRSQDLTRYGRESLSLTAGVLASYGFGLARHGRGARAGTLSFMTLVLGQMFHVWTCRSDSHGLFTADRLPPNPYLSWAVGGTAGLQALTVAVPGLRRLLGTAPIDLLDGGVIVGGALLPFLVNEAAKMGPGLKKTEQGVEENRSGRLAAT